MRYIDADAMKKDLEENYVFVGFADLLNDIIDAIDAQPTADVVERKRGKWKLGYCSECGYYWGKDAPIANVPNFCPNCGADMRERRDDDDGLD